MKPARPQPKKRDIKHALELLSRGSIKSYPKTNILRRATGESAMGREDYNAAACLVRRMGRKTASQLKAIRDSGSDAWKDAEI